MTQQQDDTQRPTSSLETVELQRRDRIEQGEHMEDTDEDASAAEEAMPEEPEGRRVPRVEMNANGPWRAQLVAGDSNPEVYPVNIATMVDSANSRLTEIARRQVDAAELGSPDGQQDMQRELAEAHATRELAEALGELFREYGEDIWMVKPGGIDESQLGNRLDFSGSRLEFVIPESRGEDMLARLTHLSQSQGAVVGDAFEYKKEFARLETTDGFTVTYRYTNSAGYVQTTEIIFLYCKERVVDGSKADNDDEEEDYQEAA